MITSNIRFRVCDSHLASTLFFTVLLLTDDSSCMLVRLLWESKLLYFELPYGEPIWQESEGGLWPIAREQMRSSIQKLSRNCQPL